VTGRQRPPLRLTEPAAAVPDSRASIARTLLDRWFPIDSPRRDQALTVLCPDGITSENLAKLENDPRYLIGRLQQALTALLAAEVPPMDATAQLLGQAIEDAISYRRRRCNACPPDGMCPKCWPNWQQASRYEALCSELGVIADRQPGKPELRLAGDSR
jgi:hypothetical protein